jgi:DNA processing protein
VLGVGRDGPVGAWPDAGRGTETVGPTTGDSAAGRPPRGGSASADAPDPPARTIRRRTRHGNAEAERLAWAVLASVEGLGPVGLVGLVARWGDARSAVRVARREDGARLIGRTLRPGSHGEALAERVAEAARGAGDLAAALSAMGVRVVTLEDVAYPAPLAAIELPPPVLFVRGSLDALAAERRVAVVGTRRPTDAGRHQAARLAGAIARAGAAVVSGLAVGIDGVAHAATLGVGGTPVAVIGGGHARAIPRSHAHLAEAIVAADGAVVSEHAPATAASRGTFPRRNRVISGLSEATIVVEAGTRSGALITAGWALEKGRECFVVPGPIDAPTSAGCLALLRTYAGQVRVVAGVGEVIEDLGLVPGAIGTRNGRAASPFATAVPSAEAALATLPSPVADVARALGAGPQTADALVARCDMPVAAVLAALTVLEDRGLAAGGYGRYHLAGALVDLAG